MRYHPVVYIKIHYVFQVSLNLNFQPVLYASLNLNSQLGYRFELDLKSHFPTQVCEIAFEI